MKNTVEKIIKRSIKICKNWKILTRNKNFTAGQKMGANALLFFSDESPKSRLKEKIHLMKFQYLKNFQNRSI